MHANGEEVLRAAAGHGQEEVVRVLVSVIIFFGLDYIFYYIFGLEEEVVRVLVSVIILANTFWTGGGGSAGAGECHGQACLCSSVLLCAHSW